MKKILVIGGAAQGKQQWARQKFPLYTPIEMEQLQKSWPKEAIRIHAFHESVKQWLEEGMDLQEKVKPFLTHDAWLVIADEIGCGVVPMDAADRQWREQTGRLLCQIAEAADEVYRIYCGIPMKIKGGA